jgi:DHA2 family multidrug resistance protein
MVQLIQGLGVALFFMPILSILLSDLQPREIAAGSGLATFLRTLGGSFAASLTTFLWDRRAVVHHERLAENITPFDPTAQQALTTIGHGDSQYATSALNAMITNQGYQISFNEVFQLLGYVFIGLVFVVWLAKPPFAAKAGPAAAGH